MDMSSIFIIAYFFITFKNIILSDYKIFSKHESCKAGSFCCVITAEEYTFRTVGFPLTGSFQHPLSYLMSFHRYDQVKFAPDSCMYDRMKALYGDLKLVWLYFRCAYNIKGSNIYFLTKMDGHYTSK